MINFRSRLSLRCFLSGGACEAGLAQSVQWIGYRLDDRGIGVQITAQARNFFMFKSFRTVPGAHQTCYTEDTRGFSPGSTAAGASTDHALPFSAKVKNEWIYTSAPHCLHDVYGNSFTCSLVDWTWNLNILTDQPRGLVVRASDY